MTSITGKVPVRCPLCGAVHDAAVVQSIDAHADPVVKGRLLAGELNVLACHCGKRTPLAATIVFVDTAKQFYCQVVPDAVAVPRAIAAFRESGTQGTQRIVRTQNELIEKIKILDAGLQDWAIERIKVGLDQRVVLFDRADEAELHWVVIDRVIRGLATPRAQYTELVRGEPPNDLDIDRAWALRTLTN